MSTKQISKPHPPKLRKTVIFLRCSEPTHENCLRMRDLLVKKVSNITQAYTTNTTVGKQKYCVIARALVEDNDIQKFENKLNDLHTKIPYTIRVEQVLVRSTA